LIGTPAALCVVVLPRARHPLARPVREATRRPASARSRVADSSIRSVAVDVLVR